LGVDALVPVVIRRRRILHLDLFDPGILARRLVEMSVQDDVSHAAGDSSSSGGLMARAASKRVPLGNTTMPGSEIAKRAASSAGSYPICVPGEMCTFLSTMARRIWQWRPMSTPSNRIDSSTCENELMRTPGESTVRSMRPPLMMQPSETSES